MTMRVECPGLDRWQSLLARTMPEDQREPFERHLEGCAHCQEQIHRADTYAVEVRELGQRLGDPTIIPADSTLLQVLQRLHGREDQQEPADLFFLQHANRPGVLGMLGPYEVVERIGQGGMGIVLKAYEPALRRLVAIKVLSPTLAGSATARRRFTREAQAAAAVSHEHVVTAHGVHEVDGLPYLVMQYIVGESLQDRLDRTGPLELVEIVRIGQQTAAGLAFAHAQGLIHRDIKPANLLLENGSARVKITDFGLARMIDDVGLTQNGLVVGTPEYMAPEQARGELVDHRADLFSLGSVLYALCTGQPPFQADSSYGVLRLVADHEPRPIRELNREIPGWLCAIVDKLMAKKPKDRYATAGEVAELLEGNLALPIPRAMIPALPLPSLLSDEIATQPGREGIPRSFPHSLFLVLVGSLVLVSGLAFWLAGVEGSKAKLSGALLELPNEEISEGVWTLAFSPDGKRLVTGGGRQDRPGQFHIWDVAAQKALISRWVHRGVRAVAYSPDGHILATGHWGGDIKLRDPLTAIERAQLSGHARGVNCLAFSTDGALLASAGIDQKVKIWDVKARRERQQDLRLNGLAFSVAFFHHGHALVTSSDDGVAQIWDLDTGKERVVLRGHTAKQVEAVAVSPDDKIVATGCWDGTIKLWDAETGKGMATLKHEEGWVLAIAFSPDGRLLASARSDGMVCIWEVASRTPLTSVRQHGWFARAVAFSPDGKLLASGGEDKTARLWNVAAGEDVAVLSTGDAELSPDSPADALLQAESKGRADAVAFKSGLKSWLTGLGLAMLVPLAVVLGVGISLWRRRRVMDKPVATSAAENLPTVRSDARSHTFQCFGCRKILKAPADLAGKKVPCPNCGTVRIVPDADR